MLDKNQQLNSIYDFTVNDSIGTSTSLKKYEGKVLLIVNVASQCGYTPQYEGLEDLFKMYGPENFVVLGFPCNQFGQQEKGSNEEIQQFCKMNYGVSFPVFAKIDVNGANASPLYKFLKENARGLMGSKMIKWNFTKFLISKNGQVLKRYPPTTEPKKIEGDIRAALNG